MTSAKANRGTSNSDVEATPASSIGQWYDLDALRTFTMLLGIVLHGALAFTPGAWVVKGASAEGDGTPYAFLTMAIHGFRYRSSF